jgi:hypothetical protein
MPWGNAHLANAARDVRITQDMGGLGHLMARHPSLDHVTRLTPNFGVASLQSRPRVVIAATRAGFAGPVGETSHGGDGR